MMHTPRTGGTWARHVMQKAGVIDGILLDGMESWHPRMVDTIRMLGPGRIYFGFVREPVDWLRSFYDYATLIKWRGKADMLMPLYKCRAATFPGFVNLYLQECPGIVTKIFRRCVGACEVVGRYERLAEDLQYVLAHAGHEVTPDIIASVPRVNEAGDGLLDIPDWIIEAIRNEEASAIDEYYRVPLDKLHRR